MKTLTSREILQLLENPSQQIDFPQFRLRKEASVKELISALKHSERPLTRQVLCDVLGCVHAKSAVPILIECLDDSSAGVRSSAADALGKIGSPDSGEALMVRFAHLEKEKSVRNMIAAVLGAVGHRPAIPLLIEALADPDPSLQGSAAWSLGVLGASEALRALEQALVRAETWYPRTRIEEAIELIKHEG